MQVEKGPRGFVVKDETGRTVFVGPYQKLTPVRDGEFFIVANGCSSTGGARCTKTGLVDKKGKVRVPLVYDDVLPEDPVVTEDCDEGSDFSGGKIRVKKGAFVGVFDWTSGREIIAPRRYSAICAFEGKVARVRIDKGRWALREDDDAVFHSVGLWGLVSVTDKELVAPVHGAIGPFAGGVARFRVHAPCTTRGHASCAHGRMGLLDTAGRVVLAPEYDAISPKLADGSRRVLQTGRMGILRVRQR